MSAYRHKHDSLPENGVFGNFDALDSLEPELGQNATFEEEASAKP